MALLNLTNALIRLIHCLLVHKSGQINQQKILKQSINKSYKNHYKYFVRKMVLKLRFNTYKKSF